IAGIGGTRRGAGVGLRARLGALPAFAPLALAAPDDVARAAENDCGSDEEREVCEESGACHVQGLSNLCAAAAGAGFEAVSRPEAERRDGSWPAVGHRPRRRFQAQSRSRGFGSDSGSTAPSSLARRAARMKAAGHAASLSASFAYTERI